MAEYNIKDPNTGKNITLKADSPPTEKELVNLFGGEPQESSEDGGEPIYAGNGAIKAGIEKNEYNPEGAQKNKWWHPVLNILPPAGAIIGGLAGEGVASVPLAAGGAMAGEQLKQLIEALSGQRRRMDAGEVAKQAAFGGVGEGTGQVGMRGFEAIQPKIAETMAHIPKEDYLRVLQSLKSGNKIFDNKFTTKEAGQAIKKSVNEAEENVTLKYSPIEQQLKDVIKSYGHNINPAKEEAMPAIQKLSDWLEKSNQSFAKQDAGADKMLEARQALESMGIKDINNPALQVKQAPLISNDALSFKDTHLAKRALQNQSGDYDKYRGDSSELIKKLASTLNKNLREASPAYGKANSRFQDVQAEEMFNANSPRYLMHLGARGAGKMVAGAHNPAVLPTELSLMAQMSPRVQKAMLQLHGLSTNAKLGGGIGSALGGMVSSEQSAYEQALHKKINPDGSIPAQQYRQGRVK